MNAEFTEKKIVITVVDGKPVITPATVRKGLHPGSFIGAEVYVMNKDGTITIAYSVVTARKESENAIALYANDPSVEIAFYDPATGELTNVRRQPAGGN